MHYHKQNSYCHESIDGAKERTIRLYDMFGYVTVEVPVPSKSYTFDLTASLPSTVGTIDFGLCNADGHGDSTESTDDKVADGSEISSIDVSGQNFDGNSLLMQNEHENDSAESNSTDTSEHCAASLSTRSEKVQVRYF